MLKPAKEMISRLGVEDTLFWTVTAVTDIVKQLTEQYNHLFVDSVANCTVYLPPVSQMTGRAVCVVNKTGSGTVTVYPYKGPYPVDATGQNTPDSTIYDGSGSQTSQVLTASAGAFTMLYSNGQKWIALAFDLAI